MRFRLQAPVTLVLDEKGPRLEVGDNSFTIPGDIVPLLLHSGGIEVEERAGSLPRERESQRCLKVVRKAKTTKASSTTKTGKTDRRGSLSANRARRAAIQAKKDAGQCLWCPKKALKGKSYCAKDLAVLRAGLKKRKFKGKSSQKTVASSQKTPRKSPKVEAAAAA